MNTFDKMKTFDTYIFDLDGTLIDSLDDLADSTNHALRTNRMPEHSRDDIRRFVGNGVRKLIERAVPDGLDNPLYDKVFDDFRSHYLLHAYDKTRPYPGVPDMLATLKARGKKLAVVSNKLQAGVEAICRRFFSDTVSVAIGEREGIRRKPAPDTVLEAMRILDADAETTVYVGDSDVDIATARNCNLACISVLWGFRDRQFLIDHGATTLISDTSELLEEEH